MAVDAQMNTDRPAAGQRWQPRFFAIWSGQAVSLVGSQLLGFALTWWLTELTGSATVLATGMLAMVLPQVLLGPFAGALVDRWNRRLVMIASDTVTALTALWLAYLFWSGDIAVWHVYAATLVRAIAGCFQWPAMQASTTLLVPDKHLTRVSGLNQSMQGGLSVIGPPLGALLLKALPFQGIMLMDVATALLAILPLCFVRIPQPVRAAPVGALAAAPRTSIWSDLRDGLRYVVGWPGLVGVMVMAMILNFVVNPAFTMLPLLVTKHFGGGALELSWLEASWGIGLVLGGLLLTAWGGFKRAIVTALSAIVLEGIGIAVIGLAGSDALWLAIASMLCVGVLNALVNGPFHALLQASVAPDMQGRVFTLVGSLAAAAFPVSLLVAGPIVDKVGVRPWFVAGGVISSLVAGAAFFVPAILNVAEHGQASRPLAAESPAGAAHGEALS
jgi:MFS transporter, DHA3 family, macrolide efflux protein